MSKRIKENGQFDSFEIIKTLIDKRILVCFLCLTILTTIGMTILFFDEKVNHVGSGVLLFILYIVGVFSFQRGIMSSYFKNLYKKDLKRAKKKMSKKEIKIVEYNAKVVKNQYLL